MTLLSLHSAPTLPPPRPVLWPLRPLDSAVLDGGERADGERFLEIRHATLAGVTPRMLAWWYGHIDGEMDYAGHRWPRYLVWHPLDHIDYTVTRVAGSADVTPGARLHVREAFQRDPARRLNLHVVAERIDEDEAVIARHVAGGTVLRLVNRFEPVPGGVLYRSIMTIGLDRGSVALRRMVNRMLRTKILPGAMLMHWAQHHVEEVGNLENFLPAL